MFLSKTQIGFRDYQKGWKSRSEQLPSHRPTPPLPSSSPPSPCPLMNFLSPRKWTTSTSFLLNSQKLEHQHRSKSSIWWWPTGGKLRLELGTNVWCESGDQSWDQGRPGANFGTNSRLVSEARCWSFHHCGGRILPPLTNNDYGLLMSCPSLGCILCNATKAVEAQGLLRNQETYYNIYVLQLLIEDIYFCDIIAFYSKSQQY